MPESVRWAQAQQLIRLLPKRLKKRLSKAADFEELNQSLKRLNKTSKETRTLLDKIKCESGFYTWLVKDDTLPELPF